MAEPNVTTPNKVVCYAPAMITTNGIWQGDNPLNFSLPIFILQLTLIVVVTRLMVFLLKPFRQPRVIAEIVGGIILGPSVLGQSNDFATTIFPLQSVMVLETMANVGLLYFMFLVGVEMDMSVIRQTGRKSLVIAGAGMLVPFIVGVGFSFILPRGGNMDQYTYILFLGVALSVTAFPVLARILAELKLINTELGRIAMSSALLNDMCAWILLALAITLAENKEDGSSLASLWVILSGVAFVLISIYIIRPLISWMISRTPEGETISEFYLCLILTGVMISGFVTDAIGTHSVFGAFVFGLIIPNGPLGVTLIEKLEDFVSGLLLPLYFAISGLRTDLTIINGSSWAILLAAIILAVLGKVLGTLLVALFYHMPIREGITLGLLMNTKGLVEMIILNVGRDQKVLDDSTFATMIIVAVIVTGIITPAVTFIYKPAKRFVPYKRRTIEKLKPDGEFRMLVCIHTPRNVPTIINLLEASNPNKKSPICAYVLHLVELTGRASAMVIVHNSRKSGRPALNRTQAQSDHIINAFENYEQNASSVTVQPLTAISPYSTMHEDICNLAEDKRTALIIVPFHKQQTVDGGMEALNPVFRTVNQNVLANAPCSVGILVDRGLNGSIRTGETGEVSHHIAVFFFGGPDDREALAYASRMSEHPETRLTVMRFIPGEEVFGSTISSSNESISEKDPNITIITEADRERHLDDRFISEFKAKNAHDDSIVYIEKIANNGEETVAAIRSTDSGHDLFIVGRGQGSISPLTAGLTDWSECPELGAIGDLLASSDFAANVSVLVIQQYVGIAPQGDGAMTPDSPRNSDDQPGNMIRIS